MGLSQLLAVGRSVRTIKNGPARYKMTQQNLLPRFGSEKGSEAPESEAASEAVRIEAASARAELPAAGPSLTGSQPGPARAVVFAEAAKKLRPFSGWSRFMNPFGRAGADTTETAPAQTELSLDLIKPLRNDLSGLDFEAGCRQTQPARPGEVQQEPMAVPVLKAPPEGGLWRRLKARLFDVSNAN